ncbi:Variable surface protein Vir7-like protein [Plasmodium coatneyi]|uniref:Variable surface protein Vir7-like protein n=1 Tax=Plasmodium coatneyi TaxID=208452 RepID=A0A1B1DWG3_9APIC|nr:Variable surface protein Vir7-like protein [Plasmodium coatneyi]ANQ07090.1 Variable surface protein Vir7-like protein [Plasmodium coatneyi]
MAKPGGTGFLHSANLDTLDSKKLFYKTLEGSTAVQGVYCPRVHDTDNRTENKLNSCSEIRDKAKQIAEGLCFASYKKKEAQASATHTQAYPATGGVAGLPPPPLIPSGTDGESDAESADSAELDKLFNKSLCHFLYFWLGKEVWNKIGEGRGTKFLQIMKHIYEALQLFDVPNNCELLYDDTTTPNNLTKELFGYRKTVFDFTFDYKGIKDKLTKIGNNSCDSGYYDHLTNAETAFREVLTDCMDKNKESVYCKEFRGTFDVSNKQNPLKLEHAQETASENTTIYNNVKLYLKFAPTAASAAAAMAAAIPSALATLALPSAAFFLYKVIYGLLPSWFGNHTFGNSNSGGRNRRSARSNFDTLTDKEEEQEQEQVIIQGSHNNNKSKDHKANHNRGKGSKEKI